MNMLGQFFKRRDDADFQQLRALVEADEIGDAIQWAERHGLARDVVELVGIVVAERSRLVGEVEAGALATERTRALDAEMEAMRRVSPAVAAEAANIASELSRLEAERREAASAAARGETAAHNLRGVNQQFATLFNLRPARAIDGGLPNAITAWFRDRQLDAYQLNSWLLPSTAPAAPMTKSQPRLRAINSN